MEIKDKVELPIMDDRIWKLFNILILSLSAYALIF